MFPRCRRSRVVLRHGAAHRVAPIFDLFARDSPRDARCCPTAATCGAASPLYTQRPERGVAALFKAAGHRPPRRNPSCTPRTLGRCSGVTAPPWAVGLRDGSSRSSTRCDAAASRRSTGGLDAAATCPPRQAHAVAVSSPGSSDAGMTRASFSRSPGRLVARELPPPTGDDDGLLRSSRAASAARSRAVPRLRRVRVRARSRAVVFVDPSVRAPPSVGVASATAWRGVGSSRAATATAAGRPLRRCVRHAWGKWGKKIPPATRRPPVGATRAPYLGPAHAAAGAVVARPVVATLSPAGAGIRWCVRAGHGPGDVVAGRTSACAALALPAAKEPAGFVMVTARPPTDRLGLASQFGADLPSTRHHRSASRCRVYGSSPTSWSRRTARRPPRLAQGSPSPHRRHRPARRPRGSGETPCFCRPHRVKECSSSAPASTPRIPPASSCLLGAPFADCRRASRSRPRGPVRPMGGRGGTRGARDWARA